MLKMRLARYGHKKMAYYRILVGEDSKRPTGKFKEILGNYNPHSKVFNINSDRVNHWLEKGVQPSSSLLYLLSKESKVKLPKWAQEQLAKSGELHKAKLERIKVAKQAEQDQQAKAQVPEEPNSEAITDNDAKIDQDSKDGVEDVVIADNDAETMTEGAMTEAKTLSEENVESEAKAEVEEKTDTKSEDSTAQKE